MRKKSTEHSERITLQASDLDFTGHWRPSAILTSMQNLATQHAETLGCGRVELLERNIIWVLSRTHLQMRAYPTLDEEVVLRTWPGAPNRFFFPRHFTFTRPNGEPVGVASTLWLLLDLGTRAIVLPSKAGLTFPDTSRLAPPLPPPERVVRVEGEALLSERAALYTDLDVNQHVNNTRYADWICDALPLETLRARRIETLLFNYSKEIRPAQRVRCALTLAENRFSMLGESEDGARTFFEVGGTLGEATAQASPTIIA